MKENLFITIKKTYNSLIEIMTYYAKKNNINHIQLSILLLACTKDVNVSILSNTLDITKSAVSQAITGLIIKKLVIKQNDINNKKVCYIRPTQKGLDIKNNIFGINDTKYKDLLNKMSIDEIIQMNILICKFNSILMEFKDCREEIC